MNRRDFFKKICITTASVCSGATILPLLILPLLKRKPFSVPLTDAEKEYVIAQALKTPEGRESLAKAMVEPIRDQVEYDETGIPCCGHDYSTMTREELVAKWGPETNYETRKEQMNKLRKKYGYEKIQLTKA